VISAWVGHLVLLFLSCHPLRRHTRNSFNSQPLISHFTNSNLFGTIQTKVLVTVSPLLSSSRCGFAANSVSQYQQPSENTGGVYAMQLWYLATRHSPLPFYFQAFAASLSLPKKSTPLQSSKSSLFFGNAGVGCVAHLRRSGLFFVAYPSLTSLLRNSNPVHRHGSFVPLTFVPDGKTVFCTTNLW
jgi:hypothetical protein